MNFLLRIGLVPFVFSLLLVAGGCGGRVTAKGQLKEDGNPLVVNAKEQQPNLRLVSESDATKSYAGDINKDDGTFIVKDVGGSGIPPGRYKVVFENKVPYPMGKDKYNNKYSDKNSKLIIEVTGAPLEINLTTK